MEGCRRCGEPRAGEIPGYCTHCGLTERVSAREFLWWLVDGPSYVPVAEGDPDPLRWEEYPALRQDARDRTGQDEAVMIARGGVRGTRNEAVFVAWSFDFLGGSMGSIVGETICRAYEYAADEGLPIVLMPSTGGARMHEGMASLVQMAATTAAAATHASKRLLQIAVLCDPTTGGVFASHANLADIIVAESGATIGFAGPRVARALTGGHLPEGSHTARGALAAGLVDAVVKRPDLPAYLRALIDWAAPYEPMPVAPVNGAGAAPATAWEAIERSRSDERPRAREFLDGLDVATELHGDRAGLDDPTIRVALAHLEGRPLIVIAMDRDRNEARITPAGYRKAWRGLRLADQLGIPAVTLIDTPGADASAPSEAGGVAHHIARTFADMLRTRTTLVSVVIGEGGSGGALALAVADRFLMQENATFSVIAPEGAAAILHRDASRAPEVAEQLKPDARTLHALGVVDELIPEPPGEEIEAVWSVVARHLDELATRPTPARLAARRNKWRHPLPT